MEKMPYQPQLDTELLQVTIPQSDLETTDWRVGLPSLIGSLVTLPELRVSDAPVDVLGTHRFEARAAVQNGRGNRALRKIGAVQEGILATIVLAQRRLS